VFQRRVARLGLREIGIRLNAAIRVARLVCSAEGWFNSDCAHPTCLGVQLLATDARGAFTDGVMEYPGALRSCLAP
jgi:hypothetical protein